MITVKRKLHFATEANGRQRIQKTPVATDVADVGRVPRKSRLMALAIHCEQMIREGEVADQTELARLLHVSQPRMTQIMNLLLLAPDIQEALLFLPRTVSGKEPIHEKLLRPIAAVLDWARQRAMWAGR
ncbi:hypothetical protein CA54_21830 [Symmachiella macrocystis]|uniref:Uncharacterized protein n=1 Tax=Symmachiella macrocystis TaxID=2527985 RepID=A0A5C6BMQ6_9PLAN|nr:hypothetical protein [Symmachiella macrocystis]TWU13348.1 hypothetical protein CA54_21830 [Symmachiella macrocystis]